MARQISNFSASNTRLWLVEFYTLFGIQEQNQVSLKIREKS